MLLLIAFSWFLELQVAGLIPDNEMRFLTLKIQLRRNFVVAEAVLAGFLIHAMQLFKWICEREYV